MKLNKRTIFEIVLFAIIALQAVIIYWLYDFVTDKTLPQVSEMMEGFACSDKITILMDIDNSGDIDALFNYGEQLLSEGWDNDKVVLNAMARAYYAKGDKHKAAELLNKSIEGKYFCEYAKPSENGILLDEAMTRYALSELYQEIGYTAKASEQLDLAYNKAKLGLGDKFNDGVFRKICENASFKRIKGKNGS